MSNRRRMLKIICNKCKFKKNPEKYIPGALFFMETSTDTGSTITSVNKATKHYFFTYSQPTGYTFRPAMNKRF